MPVYNKGYFVSTRSSPKEFTIEIVELNDKPYISETIPMQQLRYQNLLEFWEALEKHVDGLQLEERLGVPVRYKMPSPYSKVFKWINQYLDFETLFSKQSELY